MLTKTPASKIVMVIPSLNSFEDAIFPEIEKNL
jgi:hypothetical protein